MILIILICTAVEILLNASVTCTRFGRKELLQIRTQSIGTLFVTLLRTDTVRENSLSDSIQAELLLQGTSLCKHVNNESISQNPQRAMHMSC